MTLDDSVKEEYDERFGDEAKRQLRAEEVPPKIANKYNERFDSFVITNLFEAKCLPEQADQYDKRFDGLDIARLFKINCSPEQADKYNKRFDGWDIAHLVEAKCSPEEAEQYDDDLYGWVIATMYAIGITPDKLSLEQQYRFGYLLEQITNYQDVRENTGKYNLIGTGAKGVVLLKENSAWKFLFDIKEEYELLKRVNDKHDAKQQNVARVRNLQKKSVEVIEYSTYISLIIVELEYINGDSLENIIKQQVTLPVDKVFKYSADIMNGLIEMRQAGIFYHRDIRPANIMIDFENDRAVIIDLGLASTDRRALPEDNRRFGSAKGKREDNKPRYANDLTSLGQTMYYMATGKHIFDQSQSMSKTFGSVAEQIDDYRTKVYADETGKLLEMHLKQVEHEIKDERLAHLIKTCLTAKHYQYGKVRRMFERYLS